MIRGKLQTGGRRIVLLAQTSITTAVADVATTPVTGLEGAFYVIAQAKFVYGSGGTSADFYIQTTFDNEVTWQDIICFAFATTAKVGFMAVHTFTALGNNQSNKDGALTDNTILNGVLGDRLRVKYTTTGTYASGQTPVVATSIKIDCVVKG